MLDIQNQTSAGVFQANYYDYFARQAAFSNHSFHLSFFDSFSSIAQQLVAVPQLLHMHRQVSFQAAF